MIDPYIRLMYWLQFNTTLRPGRYPSQRDRDLLPICVEIENECRERFGGVDREWAIQILLEKIMEKGDE